MDHYARDSKGPWANDVPMVDSPTSGKMSSSDNPPVETVTAKGGNNADAADIYRMGKTQETKRNFRFVTIFGFTMVLMATWEGQLDSCTFALLNGGTAGAIWTYLGTYIGFLCSVISMAEMASMAPTTGGQYHWVSELAPPHMQKYLSYAVGWLCTLGWQVGNAAIGYLAGTMIQGLITLNNPDYVPQQWQGTLMIWAVLTFSLVFNTFFASKLPMLEGIILVLHVLGFFAVLIPLWVLGNPSPAHEVFFTFQDGGGWGNQGLSCLVGMLSAVFTFIGPDSAAHMAEELRDASRSLPLAMVWTAVVNGAMGWIMIITLCFFIGDISTILETSTGYPFIQVLYNVTGSKAGTSVLVAIIIVVVVFGCVTNFATSSRQMWAFARDNGFPFSSFMAKVHPRLEIPLNAVLVSYVFAMIISCINFGSAVAFNVVTSLATGALLCSYIVSISCLVTRRLQNRPLLPRRFDLGAWGLPINVFSVAYLSLVFIMTFFPESPVGLTAVTFNWNILIFTAVLLIAATYFVFRGRKVYTGPVVEVRKIM